MLNSGEFIRPIISNGCYYVWVAFLVGRRGRSCVGKLLRNVNALLANVGIAKQRFFAPGIARRCPRGHTALGVSPHFQKQLVVPISRGNGGGYVTYKLYRVTYPGSAVAVADRSIAGRRANGGGGVLMGCRCSLKTYVFYRLYIGTYPRSTVQFSARFRGTMFSHDGLILALGGGWGAGSVVALRLVMFVMLTLFVTIYSMLTIAASHVLHTTACLLFILFNATNVCFRLGCSFLKTMRLLVCTNNVAILCMFDVLLASSRKSGTRELGGKGVITKTVSAVTKLTVYLFIVLGGRFLPSRFIRNRLSMHAVNRTLVNVRGCRCVLPFRMVDILLLTYVMKKVLVTEGE